MAVWALFRAVARVHPMCVAYGMEMKSDFWVVQLLLSELGVNLRALFPCLFYCNSRVLGQGCVGDRARAGQSGVRELPYTGGVCAWVACYFRDIQVLGWLG
jgi:hypothetical protein